MRNWKPILIPVLFAVACGGTAQPTSAAMTERPAESVECSLALPPASDAATIAQTVKAVTDGSLDPCQGALSHLKSYVASLERIDKSSGPDAFLVLVFWMRIAHPAQPPTQQP